MGFPKGTPCVFTSLAAMTLIDWAKEQTTPASLAFFDESLGLVVSAPWIHGVHPQLGIWHNQAQGKSTVDSWWVNLDGGKNASPIVPWIWWVN